MNYLGHDYVEIAGVKWATMNVGASNITDTGLYFQWGDIQGYTIAQVGNESGKKAFSQSDYKYGSSSPFSKYDADEKTTLEALDDAVRANWDGIWRMPTTAEFIALSNAVDAVWTNNYNESGVAGLVCTDKTDSSKVLFFPAAGYCLQGSDYNVGNIGYYWSSSLYSQDVQYANYLDFDSSSIGWQSGNYRYSGCPVRGVFTGIPKTEYLDYYGLQTYHNNINTELNKKANKATTLSGYGIQNAYTKSEVNGLVTTPNVQYVTVEATQQTTAATDVLPVTGSSDTIYRIAKWGGSQYDQSVYSEYAWNGSTYVLLSLHSVWAGMPIVLQSTSTALIEPNKINLWTSPISTLEISFATGTTGYVSEYIIDFTCPSNAGTVLTLPEGIIWANDDELIPEPGIRYQISILDGLAIYAEWEAAVI